jgi:glycerol-3-phosphate acyltransferase PlsY
MIYLNAAIALVGAYLLGSIPFGLIAGRVTAGIDIRERGSHNLGATNAFRVLGPLPGALVLVADAAKGAASVLAAKVLVDGGGTPALLVPVLCAPVAMAGHTWTVFAGFRGGKGVAAGAGAFLALAPAATAVVLGVWAVVFATTGYVSAGSIAAAAAFPVSVYLFCGGPDRSYLLLVSLLAAVLVLARHVPNMKRLAAGTENKVLRKARR